MTLYLKYRPQSFADVVGQDHIVTTFENAISLDRIGHAYLFSGTRGTGKTSVARILAKTILLRGIDDEILRKNIVTAVEDGSFVDLIEIDGASNRKIEDVRELIEKLNFSPAVSKAKVYIIDEVHMLTKEAFNALLKTLEEPPEYAYFILATTELHKVPATIQSRCQRFLFRRVKDDDVTRRLQYIADQEHIKADREALRAIAKHASGSFRDGIALLDQLHSLEKITIADVAERSGKTAVGFLEEVEQALTSGDAVAITALVKRLEEAGIPLDTLTGDLLMSIRESMHGAVEQDEPIAAYIEATDVLLRALREMRVSPVPGLSLEAALLTLCRKETKERDLPRKNQKTTASTVAAAPETIPSPASSEKPEPDTKKRGTIEAEALTLQSILSHWEEILKATQPASVRMSLKNATVAGIDGSTVRLTFTSSFHRDNVSETKACRTIEALLEKIYRIPVRVQCALEKSSSPTDIGPATDLAAAASEVFGSM